MPADTQVDSPAQAYCALLEVSESIAQHRDLAALFQDLAQRLRHVVQFDYLNLVLHDPANNVMRLHTLAGTRPPRVHPEDLLEAPVDGSPAGWVWKTQQALLIENLDQLADYPRVQQLLRDHDVQTGCMLPLTTAHRRLGTVGFGRVEPVPYTAAELDLMRRVAAQIAVAVDNALNYESAQTYQQQLTRERDRLSLLLEVNNAVVSTLDIRELFSAISASLRRVMHHEYTSLALYEPESKRLRLYALDFPGGKGIIQPEMLIPVEGTPSGEAFRSCKPLRVDSANAGRFESEFSRRLVAEGLRSGCCLPLCTRNRTLGTLNVASLRENAFSQADVDLLSQVANQIAIAVENAMAYRQIADLKDKLAQEKLYLEDEIRTEYNFEEIIGESPVWKRILKQVETVAPTDSTVMILGESGTGKELIARAIHNLSARRERAFMRVNCAAIPTGLLESELFGHEKGAFTGAIAQKVGRFELANKGTLFLDEVGDIPLELQPKLLRVLQERDFERLGSSRTIHVDVRLVAATNRDLSQMVAERQFRSDLYYRLNVFPIVLPPLRERAGDIPLLVRYFAQKFSLRMNRRIESIPSEAMDALCRWHWPGNVRELENFIERAVILSRGPALHIAVEELKAPNEQPGPAMTLEDAEREHILRTLRETNWVLAGPHGAAARLAMKRTTLQSKMRKLGISRTS